MKTFSHGFSLLELLTVLILVSMVLLGAYQLYSSGFHASRRTLDESVLKGQALQILYMISREVENSSWLASPAPGTTAENALAGTVSRVSSAGSLVVDHTYSFVEASSSLTGTRFEYDCTPAAGSCPFKNLYGTGPVILTKEVVSLQLSRGSVDPNRIGLDLTLLKDLDGDRVADPGEKTLSMATTLHLRGVSPTWP
ncbi:MAG: prepilin-type N-terminal cleavage/methylation domain-containing protein [Elusimicrobia bacterium]|nr:prepilin-type N-terminal cleavage/methylation domain-containing protein [Elusimicrobiota bacterium]